MTTVLQQYYNSNYYNHLTSFRISSLVLQWDGESIRSNCVFFSPRTRLANHWTLRKIGLWRRLAFVTFLRSNSADFCCLANLWFFIFFSFFRILHILSKSLWRTVMYSKRFCSPRGPNHHQCQGWLIILANPHRSHRSFEKNMPPKAGRLLKKSLQSLQNLT